MKGKNNGCIFLAFLLLMLISSTSWAASITGTVSYGGSKSGRIYLSVEWQGGGDTGIGVSITSPGGFTIDGVKPNNSYVVRAFMDTKGTNVHHANDPSGASSQFYVSADNASAGTITLTDPSVAVQTPGVMVFRANGSNFMIWDSPETNDGLAIADKFTVSWSTSESGTPLVGSSEVVSGLQDFFVHNGGATNLYYQVTAHVGATTASSAWTPVPAASGTGSVTGKVNFSGSATGPLYVILVDESANPPKLSATTVTSPVSGGSYTITNVPAGDYFAIAFLDMNNNGAYDLGDVGWLDNDDFFPRVTVSTGAVTASDIALNNVNASINLHTQHGSNEWGEWYNVGLTVQSMKRRVVNVEVLSGPQLSSGFDVALDDWQEFNGWINVPARPTVGDTYQVKVTYDVGDPEIVSRQVTGVLDGLPVPLAPVGYIAHNATPTFSWSAPVPAPSTDYVYGLWMNGNNGDWWDVWAMPSSTTSLDFASQGDYNTENLTDDITYNWTLEVKDKNGNYAETQATFTSTTSPAINSFAPAGGLTGTEVTIYGVNFNPNPASNFVLFNGVTAPVSAATSTSLTVTVPNGATTGKIQVGTTQSAKDFIVAAPVTIQGYVKDSAGAAIAGAKVDAIFGQYLNTFTTTAADGSFTLNWYTNQTVVLKITKSGFVPTYTRYLSLTGNLDLKPYPSHLYTQAELSAWGVTPGKSVIVGQVLNTNALPYTAVSGAIVTAQNNSISYPVTYYNGVSFGGSSTYSNGLFFVKNLEPWQQFQMVTSKSVWHFNDNTFFETYVNSVTEGGVFGYPQPPYMYSFAPVSGKVGESVTISGSYFSDDTSGYTVKFDGVTATVTASSTNSLTVTVPAGATTGSVSVSTTAGGTIYSGQVFTVINTLSASVADSVGGTVTSSPAGIACTSSASATTGCTADFDQGTLINLTATEQSGYGFKNWSGACNGTTPTCSFNLNSNMAVTATFEQLLYIKNGANYYSFLQNAFDAALNNDIILVQNQTFTDSNLIFNRTSALVKFKGGYDNSFSSNTGFTTLDGKLFIRNGSLRVEKLKIK